MALLWSWFTYYIIPNANPATLTPNPNPKPLLVLCCLVLSCLVVSCLIVLIFPSLPILSPNLSLLAGFNVPRRHTHTPLSHWLSFYSLIGSPFSFLSLVWTFEGAGDMESELGLSIRFKPFLTLPCLVLSCLAALVLTCLDLSFLFLLCLVASCLMVALSCQP